MNKKVNEAAYDMFVFGFLIQEELTKEKCEEYLRSLQNKDFDCPIKHDGIKLYFKLV